MRTFLISAICLLAVSFASAQELLKKEKLNTYFESNKNKLNALEGFWILKQEIFLLNGEKVEEHDFSDDLHRAIRMNQHNHFYSYGSYPAGSDYKLSKNTNFLYSEKDGKYFVLNNGKKMELTFISDDKMQFTEVFPNKHDKNLTEKVINTCTRQK